jgi:hypothetical protein
LKSRRAHCRKRIHSFGESDLAQQLDTWPGGLSCPDLQFWRFWGLLEALRREAEILSFREKEGALQKVDLLI